MLHALKILRWRERERERERERRERERWERRKLRRAIELYCQMGLRYKRGKLGEIWQKRKKKKIR